MSFKDDLVDRARKSKVLKYIYLKVFSPYVDLHVKEIALTFHFRPSANEQKRLNLLVPSISREHVYGGIATALDYFNRIAEAGGYQRRIVIVNAEPRGSEVAAGFPGYRLVDGADDSDAGRQIVPCLKGRLVLPVGREDFFFATAWWTAYCAQKIAAWQAGCYAAAPRPMVYLIQDFEPGFYPWSSEYLLAESTYRYPGPVIALFNTKLLQKFFHSRGYSFTREFSFEPGINEKILQYKNELDLSRKKKQIVVYGRPSAPRNAFALIAESLKVWAKLQPEPDRWKVISAGEKHRELDLGNGVVLQSKGKLPLAEYAKLLAESSVGLSLMVSPHPSYPPLEMAEFGLHVVTNGFQSKDLSRYYANITSLERCLPDDIARALVEATRKPPLDGRAVKPLQRDRAAAPIAEIVKALAENSER